MEELKKVIDYRAKLIGEEGGKVLAVCLSSRRNMCIHPRGVEEGDREEVDSICRSMTASWVRQQAGRELCNYFEELDRCANNLDIPFGVYTLDELKAYAASKGWCPYFLTRHFVNRANIIVFNYQYMLDPKVSNLVSRELEKEAIIVFDEAHNIDNVCIGTHCPRLASSADCTQRLCQ